MTRIIRIGFVCLALAAAVCCFAVAAADNVVPKTGSYEFNNISLADALQEISRDTGIVINAPFDALQDTLQKSYENTPVDEIIQDLMHRQNYAIVWHYQNRELVTVDIMVDDDQNIKSGPATGGRTEAGSPLNRAERRRIVPRSPDRRIRGVEPPPMPPGLPF